MFVIAICVFSAVVSNLGLDRIVAVAAPVLDVVYPPTLVLIFISLVVPRLPDRISRGAVIGALTGYFGGWGDEILMRLCDSITAFPSILLALVVIAVLGPGKWNVIWVLGILFIPSFARIVRGEFARCKHLNYIKSARLMGAGPVRIMVRHILPNTLPVLLPAISIGFNNAVLAEASMSFLGVGVSATEPSLGRMLSDGQGYLLRGLPWYALCVGVTIVLLILGFSLLGEGLQQRRRR